jgi:Secretion system C-terminal sorting domain
MKPFLIFTCLLINYLNVHGQVFDAIYTTFQTKCVSCHSNAAHSGNLDLEGSGATIADKKLAVFNNLVNKTPSNAAAAAKNYKLVYPGRADLSFLFHKVNNAFEPTLALGASEGASMPRSGTALTNTEKEFIRQWVLYGANRNTTVPEGLVRAYYDTTGRALEAFPQGAPAAPAANEGFQIKMGPFFLAPQGRAGSELEYYQKHELLNLTQTQEVNRLNFLFSNFSHHFIIYNFTNNGGATIPAGLRLDPNHSNVGLSAAVQEPTDLKLPAKTAFKWEAGRVLDLNSHYINYDATRVYKAEAYVNVYTQPVGTARQEMRSLLIANQNINIPANNQTVTTESPLVLGAVGQIYTWGVMGHTHKYGTGYKVFKRLANGTKGEILYDAACSGGVPGCAAPSFDYRHIPMRYYQPFLPIMLNPGFIHQASWRNYGNTAVTFGPTSNDEMMVLIVMYLTDTTGIPTAAVDLPMIAQEVTVAPNPMLDKTTLTWHAVVSGRCRLRLFDLNGREVQAPQSFLGGESVDIQRNTLATGVYIYALESESGQRKQGKLVIQ